MSGTSPDATRKIGAKESANLLLLRTLRACFHADIHCNTRAPSSGNSPIPPDSLELSEAPPLYLSYSMAYTSSLVSAFTITFAPEFRPSLPILGMPRNGHFSFYFQSIRFGPYTAPAGCSSTCFAPEPFFFRK